MISYLSETAIRQAAEDLLAEHRMLDQMPVNVELLVEQRLEIEIVPIPGFQVQFGLEGMLSQDLTRISVDERVMENVAPRYRFTLAHELGHYVLHGDAIRTHLKNPGDEPLMLWETLNSTEYKRAEWQANTFASSILMPASHLQDVFSEIEARLATVDKTFEDLDDLSKMKALRSKVDLFGVSADALRIRLIRENLIESFENPEKAS